MAFKAKILTNSLVRGFNVIVFHLASTFDTTKTKAFSIREASQSSQWKLESGLDHLSGLEVVGIKCIFQIPYVHESLLMRRDEQWPRAGHLLNGHRDVYFLSEVKLIGTAPSPKFNSCVETTRNNNVGV